MAAITMSPQQISEYYGLQDLNRTQAGVELERRRKIDLEQYQSEKIDRMAYETAMVRNQVDALLCRLDGGHNCVGISCNVCGMGDDPPSCDTCDDSAPYGDERNLWLGYHLSWYHKLSRKITAFFLV